jgi:hypothetical protein
MVQTLISNPFNENFRGLSDMTKKNKGRNEHSFSIEMGSRDDLSHVSLTDDSEGVLIKGKLGKIIEITHPEGMMIEIEGDLGVLRLDLNEKEIDIMFKKGRISK